jgi:frataxin-like iron-binding protein CyaY
MRVYDTFIFYNELDLLEIRLRELYDHVDVFVLCESNLTLTNHPKPYIFEENLERFRPWMDKIRHIKYESLANDHYWTNADQQRDAITQALDDAEDHDIVMYSDVDEIVRPSTVDYIRTQNQITIFGFHMPLCNFKFNYVRVSPVPGPFDIWSMAARAWWIKRYSVQALRNQRSSLYDLPVSFEYLDKNGTISAGEVQALKHGGWHFSYLGDNEWLADKARNTVHQEENTLELHNNLDVEKSIQARKSWNRTDEFQYEIVDLTDYFPKSCHDYPNWILPNSGIDPQELLSQF